MKKLPRNFFERKTLAVAKDLIGKTLVRETPNGLIRTTITETEAYVGPHDLACHSARGRTPRTEVMYKQAGTIYTYFIYGMHWMLNIVTEEEGFPSAVLIRGTKDFSGPGRVTKNLQIDGSLNGKQLGNKSGLWIEEGLKIKNSKLKIVATPRVGVNYAGPIWSAKPYRFVLKN